MGRRRSFVHQVWIGQTWVHRESDRRFVIKNVWRKDERVHILWPDTMKTEEVAAYWMKHHCYNTIMYV